MDPNSKTVLSCVHASYAQPRASSSGQAWLDWLTCRVVRTAACGSALLWVVVERRRPVSCTPDRPAADQALRTRIGAPAHVGSETVGQGILREYGATGLSVRMCRIPSFTDSRLGIPSRQDRCRTQRTPRKRSCDECKQHTLRARAGSDSHGYSGAPLELCAQQHPVPRSFRY